MSATVSQLAASPGFCARCDGPMVVTLDALQRPRHRCPKCDGVTRRRAPDPNTVLVPVRLVRATDLVSLPPIEPGQLRCQGCAQGVVGNKRFCAGCATSLLRRGDFPPRTRTRLSGTNAARVYSPKPCRRCGTEFLPTGCRALYCQACR